MGNGNARPPQQQSGSMLACRWTPGGLKPAVRQVIESMRFCRASDLQASRKNKDALSIYGPNPICPSLCMGQLASLSLLQTSKENAMGRCKAAEVTWAARAAAVTLQPGRPACNEAVV